MKIFYSADEIAKEIGVHPRTIRKFATDHQIRPSEFTRASGSGGRGKVHRWTVAQVEQMKKLRAAQ